MDMELDEVEIKAENPSSISSVDSPSSNFEAAMEACVDLLSLAAGEDDEEENHPVSSSAFVSSSSSSASASSSSSGRPSSYSKTYSEQDILACLALMRSSHSGATAVSTAYFREHQVLVPPSTLQSRYHNQQTSPPSSTSTGEYRAPSHGSPLLTQPQRVEFYNWILSFSRAGFSLTKPVLNVKIMQLAALNGHHMTKLPSKHWWRYFFREVSCLHFYFI